MKDSASGNPKSSALPRGELRTTRRQVILSSLGGALAAVANPLAVAETTQNAASGSESKQIRSPANRNIFVAHDFPEQIVDLGEIKMNYAVAGSANKPALLFIPGQSRSWWGFEKAMALMQNDFHVFAVDLRGQGRTDWTPRRYTLDNIGNDLVRFIHLAVKRPVIVSGHSSGGLIATWLSAFAMPGQIRAAHLQDPPLFSSEINPLYGHSIRQGAAGVLLERQARHLGDQWSIGDWAGLQGARPFDSNAKEQAPVREIPQELKEYDPEWGRACIEGTIAQSCPHELMLAQLKTPILFTHHRRSIDPATGALNGALSDFQVSKVRELVAGTGQSFEYVDAPDADHPMHRTDPARFAKILGDWSKKLKA